MNPSEAGPSSAAPKLANSSARSCITCAKAKAKCVRQSGQQVCDRCARLHKDCQLKEPVQRRRKPTKLTRTAQLENLENKLHNLVHALSAQQAQQSQQPDSQPQQNHDIGHPSPSTSQNTSHREGPPPEPPLVEQMFPRNCQPEPCDANTSSSGPSTTHSALTPATSYQSTQPMTTDTTMSLPEASVLLDRYQRLMAPNMPFVVIADGTDAWQLAHEKPFLMQVIATVASFHDLPKQQFMVKDLMRQISEKLIMRNEKSLETLQGILILIAWYHPHIIWAQQSVLLLHLAMSLTADLNIDRAPDSCEKFRLAHGKNPAAAALALPPFTNEERRAFLGTYYLTSMMSTSFKKLSALKWSPWMTDCVDTLERHAEWKSDAFLVAIVRTQHLMEDVNNIESFEAPVRFLAKSYEADLENIPVPPLSGKPKEMLAQQRACARMAIWAHSLTGLVENKSRNSGDLRQRLDALWRCVECVRAYYELYFAIPVSDFHSMPFQMFGQSVQASVTMLRLATLEVDGWDLAALHEELNYSTVMGEITRVFEQVETVPADGMMVNNDSFTKWAAKTRWMKGLYDARYPHPLDDKATTPAAAANVAEGGRRWPDGSVQQQQQHQQGVQTGAPLIPQQPTPGNDWLTNPQAVFTYFDDAFWNSFSVEDLGMIPDMQTT